MYVTLWRGVMQMPHKLGRQSFCLLPSSFSAVPRYMTEKYLDAMAICCWYGKPHLCITVAANLNWVELKHHLNAYGGESTNSRPHLE